MLQGSTYVGICLGRRGASACWPLWPCNTPVLSDYRAAMLPWKQSFLQTSKVLAKGHPLPRSSGSITLLTPDEARTQIALVLFPLLDAARVSWLIKFKLREVKLCARSI